MGCDECYQFGIMIVKYEDLEEWRKQNPDAKQVLVKHSDGVALWDFAAMKPESVTMLWKLGQYTFDGHFVFYDKDGNRHKVFNEKTSKMIIGTHELWKR